MLLRSHALPALLLSLALTVAPAISAMAAEGDADSDLAQCSPTEEGREALPIDVQKYLELNNTCRTWGKSYTSEAVIDNVDNHASYTTTRCYTLQLRYNRLMNKYTGQNEITDLVKSCYVSF